MCCCSSCFLLPVVEPSKHFGAELMRRIVENAMAQKMGLGLRVYLEGQVDFASRLITL